MKNVLIIGATGTVGSAVRKELLTTTDNQLTLFSRSADQLNFDPNRERVVAGNVLNDDELNQVMANQDAVFVALSGNLGAFAQEIVKVMNQNDVKRLIFITSMGIYNEIPASVGADGNLRNNPVLRPYREAADIIEASDLDYTIIRPGWFTTGPADYEVTKKGEPFGGHNVSVSSIADLVKRLIEDNSLYSRESIGINTPEN